MRFTNFVVCVALSLFGLLSTAPHDVVYAQSSTASPSMGNAIGALVTANVAASGEFSAFDPRIAETVAAIGASAASFGQAVASATGTALGSVSWLAVGAAAGIGGILAGVPITLGNDTLTQWQLNHDGTVTVTPSGSGSGGLPVFGPLAVGTPLWCAGTFCGSDALAAAWASAQHFNSAHSDEAVSSISCTAAASTADNCIDTLTFAGSSASSPQPSFQVGLSGGTSPVACSSGMENGSTCVALQALGLSSSAASPSPVTESLAAAIAGTSSADDSDVMNAQLLAALVNALWSAAAQGEGYAGLPFPVNSPVTPAQAQTVEGQLGSAAPTVGSAIGAAGSLAGSSAGSSASSPFAVSVPAASNPASAVPAATDPGSGAEINLGPDPGIGSPSLETPPTAAQILAPILGLLPDLRSFTMPAHTSECPEPTFELWGTTYAFTSQCDILNANATVIHTAFMLGFAVATVLIVLTA